MQDFVSEFSKVKEKGNIIFDLNGMWFVASLAWLIEKILT